MDVWMDSSLGGITDDVAKIFLHVSPYVHRYASLLGTHLRVEFLGRGDAHIQLWQKLLTVFLTVGPADTPTSSVSGSQGPLISTDVAASKLPL